MSSFLKEPSTPIISWVIGCPGRFDSSVPNSSSSRIQSLYSTILEAQYSGKSTVTPLSDI